MFIVGIFLFFCYVGKYELIVRTCLGFFVVVIFMGYYYEVFVMGFLRLVVYRSVRLFFGSFLFLRIL